MTGRTKHRIETEIDMREDVSVQDNLHVFVRIDDGVCARTERI